MSENEEINSPFYCVPTELLFNIFLYLPAKELMKCRLVCARWKTIIDGLANNEGLWSNYCQRDFRTYFWIARKKANRGFSWYQLYRSLSLWPRLAYAVEETDEFASASRLIEEVRSIEVLGNGLIGVHKKTAIQYYDANTLKISARGPISGDYARYIENDSVIVIQSYHLHLYVIRKVLHNTTQVPNVTFHNVKLFLLTDNELFFIKLNDEVYVCDIHKNQNITCTFIRHAEDLDGVMSLGYSNDHLYIMTYKRNIYTIINNKEIIFVQSITNENNVLNILHKYNFLEQMDWRVYFQWMFVLNHTVPEGPMRNIIIIRSYGDVFFVGTHLGVLSIFYKPFINGEIDIFNIEPVRRINFMERSDIPILATCPILHIDVLEIENGHTVFVAMPKKVAVLKYTHTPTRPAPWTLGPYELYTIQ